MHATIPNAASLFSPRRADTATPQGVQPRGIDARLFVVQGQHIRAHGAKRLVVSVETGTLWITQDGCLRDWILESGQAQAFDRNADLLITAMSDASLRVMQET